MTMPDRTPDNGAITSEIIADGVYEAREHVLGASLETLVWRVYLVMDAARNTSVSASAINELK